MSYIITTRNPTHNILVIISRGEGWAGDDDTSVAEFETEQAAIDAAKQVPCCDAWGYNVVEIP
jgi:hypothetical protein